MELIREKLIDGFPVLTPSGEMAILDALTCDRPTGAQKRIRMLMHDIAVDLANGVERTNEYQKRMQRELLLGNLEVLELQLTDKQLYK